MVFTPFHAVKRETRKRVRRASDRSGRKRGGPEPDGRWYRRTVIAVLICYAALVLFLTLGSRSYYASTRVSLDPFVVYRRLIRALKVAYSSGGWQAALSRLVRNSWVVDNIVPNILLLLPLGYLLPYTFRWFRERVWTRPVGVCFLISFFTENMQLMSQRGLYDLDDMISNSLGGLAGEVLYILLAYMLIHPDWKAELRRTRKWRKKAKNLALYSRRRQLGANRALLWGTNRQAVWDFYVRKLGYRPIRRSGEIPGEENYLLLSLGDSRIEIRCEENLEHLPQQSLLLNAAGLPEIRKNLLTQGIDPGAYETDPYTGRRELRFTGPDGVQIIITEAE